MDTPKLKINVPFECPTLTETVYDENTVFFHNQAVRISPDTNINTYLNSGHSANTVLLMYTGGPFVKVLAGKFGQAEISVSDIVNINTSAPKPQKVSVPVTLCKHDEIPTRLLGSHETQQCSVAMSQYDQHPERIAADNKKNHTKKFAKYHPIISKTPPAYAT